MALLKPRVGWRCVVVALSMIWTSWAPIGIPVSGTPARLRPGYSPDPMGSSWNPGVPSLRAFDASLPRGDSGQLVGVFVEGKLAARVLEQPAGNPGYVTTRADAASHFALAQDHNTVGLVAHNTLAGRAFIDLVQGDQVVLVYDNGSRRLFIVTGIRRMQALSPSSATSAFRDLAHPDGTLTAQTVFNEVYGGTYPLVMQTCITQDGNDAWGRLFVLAQPASAVSGGARQLEITARWIGLKRRASQPFPTAQAY
jgi:hypothetical protein